MATDATDAHVVVVSVDGQQIGDWTSYELSSSVIEPCDHFSMIRPVDPLAYELCATDRQVTIAIDGITQLVGRIDRREYDAKAGTLSISGRDLVGRLVQESIPAGVAYDGLALVEIVKKLAAPWFRDVVLSNADNRAVRRGRGAKARAGKEPLIFPGRGKIGRIDPGEMRWQVIEKLCQQAGIMAWSSANGRTLILGKPNYTQAPQWLFRHSYTRTSNVRDLKLINDVTDAYALVEIFGAGAGDDSDYGAAVASRTGTAKDGPFADGTGGLFLKQKRLVMSQHATQNNADAAQQARQELMRRRFRSAQCNVEVATHGQKLGGTTPTLFAPDTIARVQIDDIGHDALWWVHTISQRGARDSGETTSLEMVPVGTEVYQ